MNEPCHTNFVCATTLQHTATILYLLLRRRQRKHSRYSTRSNNTATTLQQHYKNTATTLHNTATTLQQYCNNTATTLQQRCNNLLSASPPVVVTRESVPDIQHTTTTLQPIATTMQHNATTLQRHCNNSLPAAPPVVTAREIVPAIPTGRSAPVTFFIFFKKN